MGPLGLPFDEVVLLDFEFRAPPGELPEVVCMVAHELASGRRHRLWADELGDAPPFPVDDRTLVVAFFASAEVGCFLQLGWPAPARVLDLYAEFRNATNGLTLPAGRGLLGAMAHHGLAGITKQEKQDWRERIMAGPPFDAAERAGILDYCESDVAPLGALLERMLPAIQADPRGLGRALLRGRYMIAVARMESVGVPLDVATLERLRRGWGGIKAGLIAAVDSDYGVYDGTSFRQWRFREYLTRERIAWPTTSAGQLQLDSDTFRERARAHPQLEPLKELRSSLGELRLMDLAVGSDGRNRTLISPFQARTGRNAPSNARFVFGPSVWIRHLIVPPPGRAVAYIDWSAQEVATAAALSGDAGLLRAVESGDPYISFARQAGIAPPDATKETHPDERAACKVAVLGTNYGMGPGLLAMQAGISLIESVELLRRLRLTFPTYFGWAEDNVHRAHLSGSIETVLGWRLRVTEATASPNSLLNFPMQANGAEMLRLACCLVTEAGIDVCAPVHDALLIEADEDSIAEAVGVTRRLMGEASRLVLGGFEIATEVGVVRAGDRYSDPRGSRMWAVVTGLLDAQAVA